MANPLTEILAAMRVHHRARAVAPDERARQRITLHWSNYLALCARCCADMKNGLFADFVHVIAIKELHDVGYKDDTLTREPTAQAMERQKKMQAPEPELINFPMNEKGNSNEP